ncbi:MAG TPA: hypothetical protein VGG46_09585, partial [Terriglobales bacterium]
MIVRGCFCGKRFDCSGLMREPEVFLLLLRLFCKKNENLRSQVRAIREIRWLEEGVRSAYL